MKEVSKAVLRLREVLKTIPQEKLNEMMARVNAMNLKGPTLKEYMKSIGYESEETTSTMS